MLPIILGRDGDRIKIEVTVDVSGSMLEAEEARLVDRQLRTRAATPAPLLGTARPLRIGRLLHAARLAVRLDVRSARPALEPRDLVTLSRNRSAQVCHLCQ